MGLVSRGEAIIFRIYVYYVPLASCPRDHIEKVSMVSIESSAASRNLQC